MAGEIGSVKAVSNTMSNNRSISLWAKASMRSKKVWASLPKRTIKAMHFRVKKASIKRIKNKQFTRKSLIGPTLWRIMLILIGLAILWLGLSILSTAWRWLHNLFDWLSDVFQFLFFIASYAFMIGGLIFLCYILIKHLRKR